MYIEFQILNAPYMKNFRTILTILSVVVLFSCKKEMPISDQQLSVNSNESANLAADSKWQAAFLSYSGNPMSRVNKGQVLYKDGYARIYNDSIKINPNNYYHTQFRLVIPSSIKIKGDSLNFEVGLKNPLNSSSIPGRQLVGKLTCILKVKQMMHLLQIHPQVM
jgi:hypothetical protein